MIKLNSIIFYVSILLIAISYLYQDEFPQDFGVSQRTLAEPMQKAVKVSPFEVQAEEITYEITPLYEYELSGIVVSLNRHSSESYLHSLWRDSINVADLCVVWGDNVSGLDLNAFDFRSGQFTCFIQTSSTELWKQFNQNQLSNNHVLTIDPEIKKVISDVRIGDEIQLAGWLSRYGNSDGFSRGTSITRDDKGNGACETIYLQQFDIVKTMDNPWRKAIKVGWGLLLLSVFFGYRSIKKSIVLKGTRKRGR